MEIRKITQEEETELLSRGWLTSRQTAIRLGVSEYYVRRGVPSGRIVAEVVRSPRNYLLFSPDSKLRYKKNARLGGWVDPWASKGKMLFGGVIDRELLPELASLAQSLGVSRPEAIGWIVRRHFRGEA